MNKNRKMKNNITFRWWLRTYGYPSGCTLSMPLRIFSQRETQDLQSCKGRRERVWFDAGERETRLVGKFKQRRRPRSWGADDGGSVPRQDCTAVCQMGLCAALGSIPISSPVWPSRECMLSRKNISRSRAMDGHIEMHELTKSFKTLQLNR